MSKRTEGQAAEAVRRALELTTEAMDILDGHRQCPDAAAHLALAQETLRRDLSNSPQD